MKRHSYILKINNPCGQEWSSMTKTDIGKFCSNCSKTVVDFTHLPDNEVLKIIEHNSGKLCGRLSQEQLNRAIQLYQPTNSSRFYKILAGLLLVGANENLLATENQIFHKDIVSIVDKENTKLTETKPEPTTDTLKNIIQGVVIDFDTKEPLSFAAILIKNTKTEVTTDLAGKFKLIIPDSLITEKIYLVITYVGYEKTEIAINKNDLPITKNIIIAAPPVLMGDVIIVKKKKWWQRKNKSSC